MKLHWVVLFTLSFFTGNAQARLVIDGGILTIDNGAALIIDNNENNAIFQTGSGYIVSEGPENRLIWSIGTGNDANYLIPFGNASHYIPVSFNAGSGSSDGQLVFSTYPTSTWKNSDFLPPGVSTLDNGTTDNSAFVIDRFWQIRPQGYSTPPTLQQLILTYVKSELASPNTISENALIAQRWNNVSNSWSDYLPPASVDAGTNSLTVLTVPGNQLYDWWTLVDASSPLPITLLNFTANVHDQNVDIRWQTTQETNSGYFEVWKSQISATPVLTGMVPAAGSSSGLLNYSLTDHHPYSGTSYYRLKSVDLDGKITWSENIPIQIDQPNPISIFPNPADALIHFSFNDYFTRAKIATGIYDAAGRLVLSFILEQSNQAVNISTLTPGVYHIYFIYKNNPVDIQLIKY